MKSSILLIDNSGLSHYTSYLARGLSIHKSVILYGFSDEEFHATCAPTEGKIEYHSLENKLPKGTSIAAIFAQASISLFFILLVELAKREYDIVHVQGHLPMFYLLIPMLKLRRKGIFWTVHDIHLRPSHRGLRGSLDVLYTKLVSMPIFLGKYANTIIVHGTVLKKQLSEKGVNEEKIHVIPHFDYRYLLNNDKNQKIKLCESGPLGDYFLFFGRIAPYKGCELLIEASKLITNQLDLDKFTLVIVGEGDISHIRKLMSKDDDPHVIILNRRVSNLEISSLLVPARALILPYIDSSQSGVIPLAYTFSKPVIVSNIGALSEYVEHGKTGLIFESGNSRELAKCIIELIKNKDKCVEMGHNANQKLLTEMSLELCCKRLNELYDKLG